MKAGKKGSSRLALLIGVGVLALAVLPAVIALAIPPELVPPPPVEESDAAAWEAEAPEETPEPETALEPALKPPLRVLVVAAPRATLVAPPEDSPTKWPVIGAAENFAIERARIVLRAHSVLEVRLSRNLEGVWHEHTFGTLRTCLVVQMLVEGEDGAAWVTIGRDGAGDTRKGPSIGVADIAVRHKFRRPGAYRLRAIVTTAAVPRFPNDPTLVSDYADRDLDIIPILVRVVAFPTAEAEADVEIPPDPDAAGTTGMPKDQ